MEPKTVEIEGKTYIEMKEGKPLYVTDGKEIEIDVPGAFSKITQLQGEAKGHRIAKEDAETKLKAFDGIDPALYNDAVEKLKKIDDKKLIDAGEVDRVKAEATKAVEDKYKPLVEENEQLKGRLRNTQISSAFNASKFIKDKIVIPPDMMQSRFENNFKIENDKVVGYSNAGEKIFSKKNPGDDADFDEALEILVESYTYKDNILKGNDNSGGGTRKSDKSGGPKTITRAEYNALPMDQQRQRALDGFSIVD